MVSPGIMWLGEEGKKKRASIEPGTMVGEAHISHHLIHAEAT